MYLLQNPGVNSMNTPSKMGLRSNDIVKYTDSPGYIQDVHRQEYLAWVNVVSPVRYTVAFHILHSLLNDHKNV